MAADNDLSNAALADIDEMQLASSSGTMTANVIIQQDITDGNPITRLSIKDGAVTTLQTLDDVDMTDPEVLTGFIAWAAAQYPADKTLLILWGHGNGWDQGDGPSPRSVITDKDNNDGDFYMPNYQVRAAIDTAGVKVDILGFDACVMGTIEALYEFSRINGVEVIIASQETIPNTGWDYNALVSYLGQSPKAGVATIAAKIVDQYADYYSTSTNKPYTTLAAIRTDALITLAAETGTIADELITLLNTPETLDETLDLITSARDAVQPIDPFNNPHVYVDLFHLASLINRDTQIEQYVNDAVIKAYQGDACDNARGISIVFFKLPDAYDWRTYDPNYKDYDPTSHTGNKGAFINDYNWDSLLHLYYTQAGLYR